MSKHRVAAIAARVLITVDAMDTVGNRFEGQIWVDLAEDDNENEGDAGDLRERGSESKEGFEVKKETEAKMGRDIRRK